MVTGDGGEGWDLPASLEGGADPLPVWVGDDPGPRRPWPLLPGLALEPFPHHRYATCHPTRLAVAPGHPWGGGKRSCASCAEEDGPRG